jgi:hypothetical protein
VEGALIGVGDIVKGLVGEVADSSIALTDEIEAVLG